MKDNNQNRHKGGRPEKPVKREKRVTIRLTKAEYFVIQHKAAKAGLSLSNYIRESAIHAAIKERFSEEHRHFFRQFIGLANNINQMAKLAHQKGLLTALFRFENDLDQIDNALKRFKK